MYFTNKEIFNQVLLLGKDSSKKNEKQDHVMKKLIKKENDKLRKGVSTSFEHQLQKTLTITAELLFQYT